MRFVEFNGRLEVEVGFKGDDEFPFRCPPTVFTHPRAFRDIELAVVRSNFAVD